MYTGLLQAPRTVVLSPSRSNLTLPVSNPIWVFGSDQMGFPLGPHSVRMQGVTRQTVQTGAVRAAPK